MPGQAEQDRGPLRGGSISNDSLSPAQFAALGRVEATARDREGDALSSIASVFERAGCALGNYSEAIESARQHARIVLHFHPDRLGRKTTNVAETLLSEGVYRNQFETGLSSGSPTAFPGGERDIWERFIFGAAYHTDGVLPSEHPKYGALELVRFPDGPAPRFGSCYFVLRGVCERTSITFMGSEDPRAADRMGTLARPHGVMAALLAEIEQGGMAAPSWPPFHAPTLGVPGLSVSRFCDLLKDLRQPRRDPSSGEPGRVLDTGIEAQVHGYIRLDRDVETVVADPAFEATPVGRTLRELAEKCGFALQWHCGFQLPVRDVPDDFRDPPMPRLAQRIAGMDGILDAAAIGRAAASLHQQPELWHEWGSYLATLQLLRQLWHVLVHYGGRVR